VERLRSMAAAPAGGRLGRSQQTTTCRLQGQTKNSLAVRLPMFCSARSETFSRRSHRVKPKYVRFYTRGVDFAHFLEFTLVTRVRIPYGTPLPNKTKNFWTRWRLVGTGRLGEKARRDRRCRQTPRQDHQAEHPVQRGRGHRDLLDQGLLASAPDMGLEAIYGGAVLMLDPASTLVRLARGGDDRGIDRSARLHRDGTSLQIGRDPLERVEQRRAAVAVHHLDHHVGLYNGVIGRWSKLMHHVNG
jgi:hypothetical protein